MIDNYFKQYFWTFHLLALALAGFLVARAANIFVGAALRPTPSAIANAPVADDRPVDDGAGKNLISTSAVLDRNVFKAEREDLKPVVEEAAVKDAAPAVADTAHCEKTALRINLVATVVSSDPQRSVAVFVDPAKNEPEGHNVGDQLLGEAKILGIEWRRVMVDHGGKCETFSIEDEVAAAPAAEPTDVTASLPPSGGSDAAPDRSDIGNNVKKVSETEYEIPKAEIDNVLGNLNVVATQARIVPSFRNGKANGFKLFSIRPGSLYSKIGIQNGDVVQKINGYEINSPDKALEIYSKLKDASSITVDLVRRGRTQTLNYAIH